MGDLCSGIAKFPSRNSFVHVFLGSTQIQGAFQYFLKAPSFALISELSGDTRITRLIPAYRLNWKQRFQGARRTGELQQRDFRFGLKFGNTIANRVNVQTRLWYSTQEEKLLLGIGSSFKIRKTDGQWEQKNSIFQNRGSTL